MSMPEEIGQLLVLPIFTRGPFAILNEINCSNIGKVFQRRRSQKAEWPVGICAGLKRPLCEIREHLYSTDAFQYFADWPSLASMTFCHDPQTGTWSWRIFSPTVSYRIEGKSENVHASERWCLRALFGVQQRRGRAILLSPCSTLNARTARRVL